MTKILSTASATSGFTVSPQLRAHGVFQAMAQWLFGDREDRLTQRLRYDVGMDDCNPDTTRGGARNLETEDLVNSMMRSRSF